MTAATAPAAVIHYKTFMVELEEVSLAEKYSVRFNPRDWMTITRYADAMKSEASAQKAALGSTFAPIHVARYDEEEGKRFVCLDGGYRVLAARQLGLKRFQAVLRMEPESEWLLIGVRLNIANAKQLSVQDRAFIAYRLKQMGALPKDISKLLRTKPETITGWLNRVTQGPDGVVTVAKPSFAAAIGSENEQLALSYQRPVVNRSVLRTLDELRNLLSAGLVNPQKSNVRDRLIQIQDAIGKLLLPK